MNAAMLASVESVIRMYAAQYSRVARGDLGFDDLCQIGRMAALGAADTFDPDDPAHATFATYCRIPVKGAIRNAVVKAREAASLDVEVGDEGGGATLGDTFAAEGTAADEALAHGEAAAEVRAMINRVVGEFESHREMVKLLVERLMEGEVVEQRFRSETSLADIASKFKVSRQYVGIVEKKLKARLAEELAGVEW